MGSNKNKPIFRDLNADDAEPETSEVESFCVNCHKNGTTKLMLTKIPFYKEIILMSFSCENCGFQNNEIQSGAQLGEKGIRCTLKVKSDRDLNRQVVKSDFTSIKIPEIDFEIPSQSQKGEVTTIEGIINRAVAGLNQDQAVRREQHPEAAVQIDAFIEKLNKLKENKNFTIILEDISGNSFIENPYAPQGDPDCNLTQFSRSKDQDHVLGIFTQEEIDPKDSALLQPVTEEDFSLKDLESEVLKFPTNCSHCGSPCHTNMKLTNIPHFKEVIIMATTCDVCGYRTNEVKSGAGIEPQGLRIEIDVKSKSDFTRDVLKSETCDLKIPELELEVGPHALGGRFTTVEGLITAIQEQLSDPKQSRMFGDSQDPVEKSRFQEFLKKFDSILNGTFPITIILDDPAGNSYIQSTSEEGLDEGLRITHYDRTFEQNEELGINEMVTENYEEKK